MAWILLPVIPDKSWFSSVPNTHNVPFKVQFVTTTAPLPPRNLKAPSPRTPGIVSSVTVMVTFSNVVFAFSATST